MLKNSLRIITATISSISMASSQPEPMKDALVVMAETMDLTNYQVGKTADRSFVKLIGNTGTARFTFDFPSGHYNIDASYMAESTGQNTYAIYIAGDQVVAWLGKPLDDQWHMLGDQRWHAPRHIEIRKGDEIRIEGLSKNGSLATFESIHFTPSKRAANRTSQESTRQIPAETATAILTNRQDYFTVHPKEYRRAFKNPLKGFRPGAANHEYGTLTKTYMKWKDLETHAGAGVDQIIETSNKRWKGFEQRNVKAIPRVYLDWPRRPGGWPDDMVEGDYHSDTFKERSLAMIRKLAEAWDNDPRVAYVEMGLIGDWGEQEFPDTREDIKETIAAQFAKSFQNKKIMIRWPNTYNDHIHNFGYYWDSFGHHDQEYYAYHLRKTAPRWQTAVIGGEVAYDWGNFRIQPGANPNESLANPAHRNFIIDRIRSLHTNHLGWISSYNQDDAQVSAGAELMQMAFGYRFVITEASYPKKLTDGEDFVFSFKVTNTGSSPLYYNWPVEVSLLDPQTRNVVWKNQCSGIDLRTWLPGEDWDKNKQKYRTPPQTYTVNQSMNLSEVPSGEYLFALAILDPAGELPSVRFAIENYFHGGRHPIGRVGVENTVETPSIADFDDLRSDNSLHYILPNP